MNCEWVTDHIDAYELGLLEGDERAGLEAHLASCQACRGLLETVRATDRAARAALAWAEPSGDFAAGVAARARGLIRRRLVAWAGVAAAAVAAVLLAALLLGKPRREDAPQASAPPPASVPAAAVPEPAAGLLVGEARDAYGLPARGIVQGRSYVAAAHAVVRVADSSVLLLAGGSEFASLAPDAAQGAAMSVLAGTVVGQVGSRGEDVAIELAPELGGAIVRTRGCEFYSAGFPAHRLAARLAFPAGSLARWPEDIRLHVFSGKLELGLGAQRLVLLPGDSAIISGGACAGTTRSARARAAELRAILGDELLARRDLYDRLCGDYARRLVELRSAVGRGGVSYHQERTELVTWLLESHSAALERMEANDPELAELDAIEAELRRLELLDEEAHRALEGLVMQIASAG